MQFNLNRKDVAQKSVINDSDTNNPNVFVIDNLGNEYQHIQAGGCAATDLAFHSYGGDGNAWFIFSPAQSGATSFRYVDLGNKISFDDLVFLKQTYSTPV
jgi:hypothetical protein